MSLERLRVSKTPMGSRALTEKETEEVAGT